MDAIQEQLKSKDVSWLMSTLNSVGDAILTGNLEGRVDFVNSEAVRILDLNTQAILGNELDEVFKIYARGTNLPVKLWEAYRQTIDYQDQGLPSHAYYTKPNGDVCHLSAHMSSLKSPEGKAIGFVIVFRDITNIVRTEDAIELERNNLKTVFELLPIGMLVINAEVKILKVNQAFTKIFNLKEAETLNLPFGEALGCINSFAFGCGFDQNCRFCQFRKTVSRLIQEGGTLKDHLIAMHFVNQGETNSKWLSMSLMPVTRDDGHEYIITLDDVTERIQYENSLNEARKSSLNILNSLPVMIYRMDKRHQCDFINQTFKTYMNITQESFLEALRNHMSLKDFETFVSTIDQAIQEETSFKVELDVLSPYGLYRAFLGIGSPYFDESGQFQGILGLFLDVHDAKMAEYLYRQSQSKYFSLFKNMENSISYHHIQWDQKGALENTQIIEMNESTYKIFGISPDQVIGQQLSDVAFLTTDDRMNLLNLFRKVISSGESIHVDEYYLETMDRYIELSIYSPEKDYIAMLVTDIDFKKRAEIELKAAIERSEQANRSKSEFLANMSHEIRTPLNGIVGMIDLTLLAPLTKDQRENLSTAKGCVHSLIDIINDVLDFAKIEAGKLRIESQGFVLSETIDTTLKAHSKHASERGVALHVHYESVVSQTLIGDVKRLKQILNNLISNAIKFTEEGDVTLYISQQESIQVPENITLKIAVKDTGIGIPKEKYSSLFKSFSQVDGSYTRQYGGTGLGLVITKQLLEMMNGSIEFESEVGKGSTFTISLPVTQASNVEKRDSNSVENFKFNKGYILLVEDDRVNQIVISKMLESFGIQMTIAVNGIEAIKLAEKEVFDLIIMDIQMPIMDGIQATQFIRGSHFVEPEVIGEEIHRTYLNRETPIIALTAFALKGDEAIFRNSGMDDYLSKPVDRAQLLAVLKKHLKNPESVEWEMIQQLVSSYQKTTEDQNLQPKTIGISAQKVEEISGKMKQLRAIVNEQNGIMLEILAHQLKSQFEELGIEELKSMAFKMELEIRKEHFDKVPGLMTRIEQLWDVLTRQ